MYIGSNCLCKGSVWMPTVNDGLLVVSCHCGKNLLQLCKVASLELAVCNLAYLSTVVGTGF